MAAKKERGMSDSVKFRGNEYQKGYVFFPSAKQGDLKEGQVVGEYYCEISRLLMQLIWIEGDVISRTQNHHIDMRNRELVKSGDTTFEPSEKQPKKVKRDKKGVIPLGAERQVRRRY